MDRINHEYKKVYKIRSMSSAFWRVLLLGFFVLLLKFLLWGTVEASLVLLLVIVCWHLRSTLSLPLSTCTSFLSFGSSCVVKSLGLLEVVGISNILLKEDVGASFLSMLLLDAVCLGKIKNLTIEKSNNVKVIIVNKKTYLLLFYVLRCHSRDIFLPLPINQISWLLFRKPSL